MTNNDTYIPAVAHRTQTTSFGVHRNPDRPASAIKAGATSRPSAWQSRDLVWEQYTDPMAVPEKSLIGQFTSACAWPLANVQRRIAALGLFGAVLTLIIL